MLALVGFCLAFGAAVYAVLAVWRSSIGQFRGAPLLLGASFAGMSAWCLAALTGDSLAIVVTGAVRDVLWVGYLGFVLRRDGMSVTQRWFARLPLLLVALASAQAVLATLLLYGVVTGGWWLLAALGCGVAFCVGAIILLHSLHFAAHRKASGFKLILFALLLLWAYDLNLLATVLLDFRVPAILADGRKLLPLLLAPVFAIAARRKERWSISLSRKVTLQSLSIVAIGTYLIVVSTIAGARPWLSGVAWAAAQIVLLILASAATVAFIVSARVRGTVKVFVSKHLFEHRYDYRTEWLRFNATINSGGLIGLSPEQRAIKALSDLMDAAGGMLFLRSARDRLELAATFEWSGRTPPHGDLTLAPDMLETIENSSHVMISPAHGGKAAKFPQELSADGDIWVVVPLVRMSGLVGLVALGRPAGPRLLDWEDFDLLKVLGQQIATYIADARSQAELEEARQFEEFNRRFAFIVHDIKNVVSQLSLVVANAEHHGANPRFQASMASTLRNAVGKMTILLSRLSQERPGPELSLAAVDATGLLDEIVAHRRPQHPVALERSDNLWVVADRAKLHTAIDHLVQNAIEASGPTDPVLVSARVNGGQGTISVTDTGVGMSADFIRRQLFKPFASTKRAGFGIGAGEARTLVQQMGGELDVQSVEGAGTNFTMTFALATPQRERAI